MTNDPLVKRIEKINAIESIEIDSLDSVLLLLKRNKFDEVLPQLLKIIKKHENDVETNNIDEKNFDKIFEKGGIILLLARFYYYHNQLNEAFEYAKKFDEFFNSLGKKIFFFLFVCVQFKHHSSAECLG